MSFSDTPPGLPLASKRQSPFHQRSPHGLSPSLIYSCFLSFLSCFCSSISHFYSIFITLWVLLPIPWLTIVVEASALLPLYKNVHLSKEYNPTCVCFCKCVLMFVCLYVQPRQGDLTHPDGRRGECGVTQRCYYGIMEEVSLVSHIIGLYRCLYLSHKHTPLTGPLHTHTHTRTRGRTHTHLYPFPPLSSLTTLSP